MRLDIRRYPRVNLRAFAALNSTSKGDINKEYNALCINIGEGGCCLELDALLSGDDIDFGVKVGIDLPDRPSRLIVNGRIIWLREENRDLLVKYLVGIEFEGLKPEDRRMLRDFVASQ